MDLTRAACLLTATALAMSGLAACGSDSEPTPTVSTASPIDRGNDSPSESSSGSGTATELPPEAREKTKAGAIAFNIEYQHLMGEAMVTGDTARLKKYTFECSVCDAFIKETEDNFAKGITMDRQPYSAHDTSATVRDDGGYKVTLTVDSSGYNVIQDGSTIGRAKSTSYTIVTDTQWREGHWVIHDSVIIK